VSQNLSLIWSAELRSPATQAISSRITNSRCTASTYGRVGRMASPVGIRVHIPNTERRRDGKPTIGVHYATIGLLYQCYACPTLKGNNYFSKALIRWASRACIVNAFLIGMRRVWSDSVCDHVWCWCQTNQLMCCWCLLYVDSHMLLDVLSNVLFGSGWRIDQGSARAGAFYLCVIVFAFLLSRRAKW